MHFHTDGPSPWMSPLASFNDNGRQDASFLKGRVSIFKKVDEALAHSKTSPSIVVDAMF
jgi:hypothetical protein